MRFEKIITLPLGTLNGKICRLSMLESTFVYSFIVLVLMFFGLWRLAAILQKMNVHNKQMLLVWVIVADRVSFLW